MFRFRFIQITIHIEVTKFLVFTRLTNLCIYTLKEVIEFDKSQSSSVYICFMDASKTFDRVNHWTLFTKLIDRGMPDVFVRLLVQWYRAQKACVRWGTACSEMFAVSNGVRQDGILSPLFFNVYIDGLSDIICRTETCCTIGGILTNHLMYADDLVILSPSAKGFQQLIDVCADYGERHDIIFNHACICKRNVIIVL